MSRTKSTDSAAGTELRPGEIGVLATVQRPYVVVGRRPTVAILSSGDELVEVGDERGPGQIVNSNTHATVVMLAEKAADMIIQGEQLKTVEREGQACPSQ